MILVTSSKMVRNCSPAPAKSTGLRVGAASGRCGAIRPCRSSESAGSSRPSAEATSEATIPCPPPSPTTTTRRPRGLTRASSACARSIELARRAHALHPGRAAGGFDCRGAADQRARVRPRRLGADLSGSDGEEDDGLPGLDRFLRGAREGPSVAEVLAVEGDDAGRLVVDQAADELARLEVGLVPERREAREAEPVVLGEQGELEREIAALRDEADRAALELAPAEVEARRGVEDPETVRPEEDGARRPNALDDRGLPGPAFVACLPEPGRDPDERLRARGERCVDGVLEPVGGNREHDELRRLGQVCQRGVGLPLEDLAAVSVHEVDRAASLAPEGAQREAVAPLRRVVGSPENRDGARIEQRPEVPAQDSRRRREMMRRWMSDVPSSISSSLASRIHFSTGYSRE